MCAIGEGIFMNRRISLMLIMLALILSACGAAAPNSNTNPQGVDSTTTTGSAPVAPTDASGSAPATAMPEATTVAPTTSTIDTTATAPVATSAPGTDTMLTPTTMADNMQGNIDDVLAKDARFSTLVKAVDLAQLSDTLKGSGPYTIFAPTNDAFATLPTGELDKLLADPTQLGQLLSYHVVSGDIRSADLATRTSLPTLDGKPIQVTTSGNEIMLNGSARLVSTEITTTNGVIHVIDKVLIPLTSK